MRQFYLTWPPEHIWQSPIAKYENPVNIPEIGSPAWRAAFPLPWTAYTKLLAVKSDAARAFYESEALRNGWTIAQLDRQIQSLFYERTASSRNKAAMLERGAEQIDSDVASAQSAIRDPFLLEFLDLKDDYSETDVEDALISHLADFLLELGDDFTFVARQRRMRIDDTWFRCDLVLYHRTLRCLMLIELKLGRYSYQDAGQMAMYISYARQNWMKPGENPPVGLILCSDKGTDEARYSLDGLTDPVLVAEYKVVLPDESVLVQEMVRTRAELERRRL